MEGHQLMFRKLGLTALAACALLLVACGGGGDDDGASSGRATGVAGVPDGAAFVDQDNLKFQPNKLSVATGEAIYFKNSDTTYHTVTVNGKNESDTMEHDDVFQWTPSAAGEYKITCDFHPQMKATITVAEKPAG
jgi:plastocyanin